MGVGKIRPPTTFISSASSSLVLLTAVPSSILMPPVSPIHEVYHQQLLPLGHGYPLWDAEPEDKRFEIEIGTVGRMDAGKFWLLFNAMKTADDPYQKHGVPVAYEPFRPPTHAPQGPWEKIKFPLVVSQTVCNRDIAAALQAGT